MSLGKFRIGAIRLMITMAAGGSAFQFGSCDTDVRSVLLDGLGTTTEALSDTLIQAFFTALSDDAGGGNTAGDGLTTT